MIEKVRVLVLSLALVLAFGPVTAAAQESLGLDAGMLETPPTVQLAANLPTGADAGSVLEALRPFPGNAALLLAPPAANLPTGVDAGSVTEALRPDDDAPTTPVMQSKGSGKGLGFMIGGAAALVGGLLIGGTGGNLIAAGGVALGVYGAIVYF